MEKHAVISDSRTISFTLTRKKVKNINLRIRPDDTVAVSAHQRVPFEMIEEFVINKASWIEKALARQKFRKQVESGSLPAEGQVL